MEHRLAKRTNGKLALLVYKRGMPVATGQVRDASRQGLFVATDYTDINLNQTLDLEFRFPDDETKRFRRLKAHVVRKDSDGLGMDFTGIENDRFTISALIRWLSSHPAIAQRSWLRRQAR